jgi:hypothetical protein
VFIAFDTLQRENTAKKTIGMSQAVSHAELIMMSAGFMNGSFYVVRIMSTVRCNRAASSAPERVRRAWRKKAYQECIAR